MVFSSHQIAQQIYVQNAMMSGQAAYAQQLSYPMQAALHPGMPPPPPMAPPPISMVSAAQQGMGGMYGEQLAAGMASFGRNIALPLGTGVLSIMGGMGMLGSVGRIFDPFGVALSAGRMGFAAAGGGMGGLAVGGLAAGAAMLPFYAAAKAAEVYGGAFMGGMNEQAALNSTLRNNFQFFGGQGPMGRGFNQQQMGDIGMMISQELRANPFTSASELNQLIGSGAQAGMFTGVRDVMEFSQKFRRMLDMLKDVQRELGGTLADALTFVRQAKQSGIFQQIDRVSFAAEIRGAEAVSGLSQGQLMQLSSQGAQLSRAIGGLGRQGAFGALRGASTLGAAVQSGTIDEESLSEATGGLTGTDAIQAMTMRILQQSARFSRRGVGRYSIFAMSNEEGTGLDPDMVQRFRAGDLTVGEVSRRAHRRVAQMGRARAMNREGILRGALLEQGGLAGLIGEMRLRVGDRVLDQSDDLASLVLQRRFRMSRPEAEVMVSLMRNQSAIAETESLDRMSASRQQAFQTDLRENRSIDAFMRHLSHGVQEATGVMKARELGRQFMSRLSTLTERAMNDVLGIAENELTRGDRAALNRLAVGRATAADIERLSLQGFDGTGMMTGRTAFQQGLLEHGPSLGEILVRRGVRGVRRMDGGQLRDVVDHARLARQGIVVEESDRIQLDRLNADPNQTIRRIMDAKLMAAGAGDMSNFYQFVQGADANAIDAFMAQRGMTNLGIGPGAGALMRRGGGRITAGMVARDALRGLAMMTGAGGIAAVLATSPESEVLQALQTPGDRAASFIARGGHLAQSLREEIERNRVPGATPLIDEQEAREIQAEMLRDLGYSEEVVQRALEERSEAGQAELRLEGLEGVTEEAVRAVAGSETFQRRMRRIQGMRGDTVGIASELRLMGMEALQIEDKDQQKAAISMIKQMEHNLRTMGSVGREFTSLPGMSKERLIQIMEDRFDRARNYRGIAERLGEGDLGNLFRRIAGQFQDLSVGGDEITASIQEVRGALMEMDPESERYREVARAIGQDETGRAFLATVARDRQLDRALSGAEGIRRRAETAFGLLTGNTLSEMNLTLNGESLSTQNRAVILERIFRRGGEDAESLIRQMATQLEARGVAGAEDILRDYQQAVSSDDGFTREDRLALINRVTQNDDLRRVQQEAVERYHRQQRPLDAVRNDLLSDIRTAVTKMADNVAKGGVDAGEPA